MRDRDHIPYHSLNWNDAWSRRHSPGGMESPARRLIRWAFIAIGAVVAATILFLGCSGYTERETRETVVTGKDRVCTGSTDGTSDCKYLVFTERGTYQLSDSIIAGRWSSSDAYGQVKVCHRYEIESYGFRLPVFSAYPNITEMTDLGRVDGCES